MNRTVRKFFVSIGAMFALSAVAPSALAATWVMDPAHSRVGFGVKHLAVSKVRGEFRDCKGEIVIDDQDISKSKVTIEIAAKSIDTGVKARDSHLRSVAFFDVAKYPKIVFVGRTFEKVGADGLKIGGDLTLKNVTKPVVFEVTDMSPEHKDPQGKVRRGGAARAMINRQEFNLTWNTFTEGVGAVGDNVTIEVDLEVVKKAEPEVAKAPAAPAAKPSKTPTKSAIPKTSPP